MIEYLELYMDRGTNFSANVELKNNTDTNLPQNATGYIISSQMRRSVLSVNTTANLVGSVVDAANGKINISLDSANTANIKPGSYVFDVKTINTLNSNTVSKIAEGVIFVSHTITL